MPGKKNPSKKPVRKAATFTQKTKVVPANSDPKVNGINEVTTNAGNSAEAAPTNRTTIQEDRTEIAEIERERNLVNQKNLAKLRIINQPPSDKIEKVISDLKDRLVVKFKSKYEIFKNPSNNRLIRTAAIKSIGALGSLIPSKFGKDEIEINLGDGVKEIAEIINDLLLKWDQIKAGHATSLLDENSEKLNDIIKQAALPFVNIFVRNFEDQIERLHEGSIDKFTDGIVNRIFVALENPNNTKYASAHSSEKSPIEKLSRAAIHGDFDTKLKTKDGVIWHLKSIIAKPRIKILKEMNNKTVIDEAIFVDYLSDRKDDKYGERWGTPQEAIELGYTRHDNRYEADTALIRRGSKDVIQREIRSREVERDQLRNSRRDTLCKQLTDLQDKTESGNNSLLGHYNFIKRFLDEEFHKNPESNRNFNLQSDKLILDIIFRNEEAISQVAEENINENAQRIAEKVINCNKNNPTSTIDEIIADMESVLHGYKREPSTQTNVKGARRLSADERCIIS